MIIDYDPAKREKTLAERGVDMARAGEVFGGPHRTVEDDRRDYGEVRFQTAGFLDGRLVYVVWTARGDVRRIISMRKANGREQKAFREILGL